jgi:hypothetical protein
MRARRRGGNGSDASVALGFAAVAIRGEPLEPALGLPRAVAYEMRWVQWLQLVLGFGCILMGLAALAGAASGHPWESKYGALIYILAPVGVAICWEAWGHLKRWPCLILAQYGFDDRMVEHPAGPVLWSEVAGMEMSSVLHVGAGHAARLPCLVVWLKPGPRQPLSPLGKPPQQIDKVTLELTISQKKKIPPLMEAAFAEWQESQLLYAGF